MKKLYVVMSIFMFLALGSLYGSKPVEGFKSLGDKRTVLEKTGLAQGFNQGTAALEREMASEVEYWKKKWRHVTPGVFEKIEKVTNTRPIKYEKLGETPQQELKEEQSFWQSGWGKALKWTLVVGGTAAAVGGAYYLYKKYQKEETQAPALQAPGVVRAPQSPAGWFRDDIKEAYLSAPVVFISQQEEKIMRLAEGTQTGKTTARLKHTVAGLSYDVDEKYMVMRENVQKWQKNYPDLIDKESEEKLFDAAVKSGDWKSYEDRYRTIEKYKRAIDTYLSRKSSTPDTFAKFINDNELLGLNGFYNRKEYSGLYGAIEKLDLLGRYLNDIKSTEEKAKTNKYDDRSQSLYKKQYNLLDLQQKMAVLRALESYDQADQGWKIYLERKIRAEVTGKDEYGDEIGKDAYAWVYKNKEFSGLTSEEKTDVEAKIKADLEAARKSYEQRQKSKEQETKTAVKSVSTSKQKVTVGGKQIEVEVDTTGDSRAKVFDAINKLSPQERETIVTYMLNNNKRYTDMTISDMRKILNTRGFDGITQEEWQTVSGQEKFDLFEPQQKKK